MTKNLLTTFFIISILFTGCIKKPENNKLPLTKKVLEKTVLRALNGNKSANDSLSNLIDYSLPLEPNYSEFFIDSSLINNSKVIFTVLMTFENPIYNRFAVYNTNLDLELIDKSLNGRIYKEQLFLSGTNFIKLTEDFLSKDIFKLTRISLYKADTASVDLVFRTFSKLIDRRRIYSQDITEINNDSIVTKLNSTIRTSIRNKTDKFIYSSFNKKYVSEDNLFYDFVTDFINKAKVNIKLPIITDRKSTFASVGITEDLIIDRNDPKVKLPSGFTISLSNTWNRIDNFMIRSHILKGKEGTRFLNNVIGSTISIIKLDELENVTEYCKYPFITETKGQSNIRATERMVYGKTFYQLFEFTGEGQTYLMIMDGSKYTYKKYENLYKEIINSFRIIKQV